MLCPETKKHCHSKGEAEAHLRGLVKREAGYAGRVYLCPHCNFWHVGRAKKDAHKNKYKDEA